VPEQPTLFEPPPATGTLTPRQKFVWDELLAHAAQGDGLTADEVGALLCERAGRHDSGSRCDWDAVNGRSVLRALRKKGLAKSKRSVGWVALGPQRAERPAEADPFPEGY
jgi:hypothetical protein